MRCVPALLALLLIACQPAPSTRQEGHNPDLVTLFGPLAHFDRGVMQPAEEPLFASYGLTFDQALGLDSADLSAFEHETLVTDFPAGGDRHSFTGPRLRDVLAFAGAADRAIRVTALDGYQRDITAEAYMQHNAILALYQDGQPLGIGGRGPAMLVWPRGTDPALDAMSDDDWVFGVFAIEVLPD